MASEYRSGDELWREVMKVQVERHGEIASKRWKAVSREVAECVLCDELGGGALIRCNHEKCNKYFHLDCAFHNGGLSLSDSGLLTYECDAHFKHVVFCKCRTKYENTKPMVFCDECCDWYHESCENIKPNDLDQLDKYICTNCRAVLKTGKHITQSVKDKNLEKEARSFANQNAITAVGILVEIASQVCPVMDSLYGHSTDPVEISDVREIIDYLSSAAFRPPKASNESMEEGDKAKSDEADFIQSLGVLPLLVLWKQHAVKYLDRWAGWQQSVVAVCQDFVQDNEQASISLRADRIPKVTAFLKTLQTLEKERTGSGNNSEKDLEAYHAFVDCVQWMQDFLQTLHSSQNANWTFSITSHLRAVNAKSKRLHAFPNDTVCKVMKEFFQSFVRKASETTAKMGNWIAKASKINDPDKRTEDYKLEDLEAFASSAAEFPCRPYLSDELEQLISTGRSLEEQLKQALDITAWQEDQLEEIDKQKNALGLLLPSENIFAIVKQSALCIKAFQIASMEGRLQLSIASSLLEELESSLNQLKAVPSPAPALCATMITEIEFSSVHLRQSLSQAQDDATAFHQQYTSDVAVDEVNKLLERFQSHMIIMPEEELLIFIRDSLSLGSLSEQYLSNSVSFSMEDLENLLENIRNAISNTVIDPFPQVAERKLSLKKHLSSLTSLHSDAEKRWSLVSSAVQDLQQGMAVTFEVLRDLLQAAEQTGVGNDAIAQLAKQSLEEGKAKENECVERLASITEPTVESLTNAKVILDIVHRHPIPLLTASRVRLRYEACEVAVLCAKVLKASSDERQTLDPVHLRDCRQKIQKLENQLSTESATDHSIEDRFLQQVREPFLTTAWKHEVQGILSKKTECSLTVAEKLLSKGQELKLGLESTAEWMGLQQATEAARNVATDGERILLVSRALLQTEAIGGDDIGKLGSMSLKEVIQSPEYATLKDEAQQWLTKSDPVISELKTLNSTCATLIINKEEEATKVACVLDSILLHQDAATLVIGVGSLTPDSNFLLREFKDLIALANKVNNLIENQQASVLMSKMALVIKAAYAEVNLWMERVQTALPLRALRHRNRFEAQGSSMSELQQLTGDVSGRICQTAMHTRIEEVKLDIQSFQTQFLSFLIKPSNQSQAGDLETIRDGLREDTATLSNLTTKAELIPIDLPEFFALKWVSDLFTWMENSPFPGEPASGLQLDQAQKLLLMGLALIRRIPGAIIQELQRLGVMQVKEESGEQCFHPDVHKVILHCGEVYDYLDEQAKRCLAFQKQVQESVRADASPQELAKLVQSMRSLFIQPEAAIKRSLEKTLAAKGQAVGTSTSQSYTPSGRMVKKRQSDDVYFYEEDDFFATTNLHRQQQQQQLQQQQQQQLQAQQQQKEVKAVKPAKKVKQFQCAAKDCGKELKSVQWSGFCSDSCAIRSATEMFAALWSYKQALPSLKAQTDVAEAYINDYKAFELPEGKGNALDKNEVSRLHANDKNVSLWASMPALCQTVTNRDMIDSVANKSLKASPRAVNPDLILRSKARTSLEEFFTSMLIKLKVKGDIFLAGLLAEELEEATFEKYSSSGQALDVKEYRKHCQMLLSNLRQPHNESIMHKLASGELSMEQLLGMSVQQFADTTLQQLRQKQLSSVVEDAHRQSTEEVLEEKRRAVMTGRESWRDRETPATSADDGQSSKTSAPGIESRVGIEMAIDTSQPLEPPDSVLLKSPRVEDSAANASLDGSTPRSLEIEERIQGQLSSAPKSASQSKRSLDIDAGSRFTTNRPKVPRLDTSEADAVPTRDNLPKVESPKLKAPSLLELLKAKGTGSADMEEDEDIGRAGQQSSGKHSSKPSVAAATTIGVSSANFLPSMRLVSKEGGVSFTITRPGGIIMNATAMTNERRVQGAVKPTFNIDGRTRIKELDRFIQEVIATGRKMVATCAFLVFHNGLPDCSYNKFCDEFTRDQRAGISNVAESVQLYVIPPALKDSVQILTSLKLVSALPNTGVLYGLIVAKESGPAAIVNSLHASLPFTVSSFAVLETVSQSLTPSSSTPSVNAPSSVISNKHDQTQPFLAAGGSSQLPTALGHKAPAAFPPVQQPISAPLSMPMAASFPIAKPTGGFSTPGNAPAFPIAPGGPGVSAGMGMPGRGPVVGSMPLAASHLIPSGQPAGGIAQGGGGMVGRTTLPVDVRDKILQTAQFCANNGVAKLQSLKNIPSSRTVMPFLFEGNPGYEEFMQALRECVGLAGRM
eukprot:gene2233-2441_t